MRAIEFEAIAKHNMLRIPDKIPDGTRLRVRVLVEEPMPESDSQADNVISRQKPSPKLADTVRMRDDLIASAVPPEDWDALK